MGAGLSVGWEALSSVSRGARQVCRHLARRPFLRPPTLGSPAPRAGLSQPAFSGERPSARGPITAQHRTTALSPNQPLSILSPHLRPSQSADHLTRCAVLGRDPTDTPPSARLIKLSPSERPHTSTHLNSTTDHQASTPASPIRLSHSTHRLYHTPAASTAFSHQLVTCPARSAPDQATNRPGPVPPRAPLSPRPNSSGGCRPGRRRAASRRQTEKGRGMEGEGSRVVSGECQMSRRKRRRIGSGRTRSEMRLEGEASRQSSRGEES